MIRVLSLVLLAAVALSSCFSHEKPEGGEGLSNTRVDPEAVEKCFSEFDYDYSKILSKADVLKVISAQKSRLVHVTYDAQPISKHYNHCTYTWPSDRPEMILNIAGHHVKMEDKNSIQIGMLSISNLTEEQALTAFEMKYKFLTRQEIHEMQQRMGASYAGERKAELQQAKLFLQTRKDVNFNYLGDVGTAAYWRDVITSGVNHGIELYVLAGKVEFKLAVKTSNSREENVRMAKRLAKIILAKCN